LFAGPKLARNISTSLSPNPARLSTLLETIVGLPAPAFRTLRCKAPLFFFTQASNSGSGSSRSPAVNALYEWSEVDRHPGLMLAFSHQQGCPVVIMVEPEQVIIQELKVVAYLLAFIALTAPQ